MNKRMNQHGHIKCCKWFPWQYLDRSWFALYFHRQRNIKFSFRRHILYWYSKINLLVVPKARPLRTKFQKSSCRRHENSIHVVGMNPMATHCRKLIVTGIYQVKSYIIARNDGYFAHLLICSYLRWRRRDVCNFHMIYLDDIIHNCMCVIFWTWKWYIESSWIKWNKN